MSKQKYEAVFTANFELEKVMHIKFTSNKCYLELDNNRGVFKKAVCTNN